MARRGKKKRVTHSPKLRAAQHRFAKVAKAARAECIMVAANKGPARAAGAFKACMKHEMKVGLKKGRR